MTTKTKIILDAEMTATARGAFKSAKSGLKDVGDAASSANKLLAGLGVGLSVAGLVAMTVKAYRSAEAIVDFSKALGIGTEDLQAFRYASDLVGVSQEKLESNLQKLSLKIGDAVRGNKDAAKSFFDLGIKILDSSGKSRDVGDIYRELAGKISEVTDANEKAALASDFFGKGGKDMVNALSPEFIRLADDAKRVGAVIKDDVLQSMAAAKDKADAMSRVVSAQLTRALANLTPVILKAAEGFAWLAEKAGEAYKNIQRFDADKNLDAANKRLDDLFKRRDIIAKRSGAAAALQLKNINDQIVVARAAMAAAQNARNALLYPPDAKPQAPGQNFFPTITDTSTSATAAARDANADYVKNLQEQAALLGLNAIEAERFKAAQRGLNAEQRLAVDIALTKRADFEEEAQHRKDLIEAEAKALDVTRSLQERARAIAEQLDPQLALNDALKLYGEQLAKNAITQEQYNLLFDDSIGRMIEQTKTATDEISEFWREAARNMQSSMSGFFFDIMQGNLSDLAASFKRTIDQMVANVLAAKAATALFGSDFAMGGSLGGLAGTLLQGITGKLSFPEFAHGGTHAGGLRLVGERGPELEYTGPSRIFNAAQTKDMLSGANARPVVVQMTINTPDANSFRASQAQIMASAAQQLANASRRNN